MTQLDILSHRPDEFQGKTIVHNGCQYVLSKRVDSGAGRVVHKLVNRRSGLCVHVVKIWRDQHRAAVAAEADLAAARIRALIGTNVLPFENVAAHGGLFQMQTYVGPYEDENSATHKDMAIADAALETHSPAEAARRYYRILETAPLHTAAMNNLATVCDYLGNADEAFTWQLRATRIEPNHFPYQTNLVTYAAAAGKIGAAMQQYEKTQKQFPFQHQLDELAVRVYERAGYPHKALAIVERSPDEEFRQEHQKRLQTAAGDCAHAEELLQKARTRVFEGQTSQALPLLVRASRRYGRHPLLRLNLGLARIHGGEYAEGRDLLMSVVQVLPLAYLPGICFNAAAAEVRLGNVQRALQLFQGLHELLSERKEETGVLRFRDLPGSSSWIDEAGSVEREPSMNLSVLENAIRSAGGESRVPQEVRDLKNEYKRAADRYQRTHGGPDKLDNR